MSKRIISLIAAMCLLLSSFSLMNEAHAFQTVVSIGNPGRVNQGSNVTITFTVSETSGKFVTYDGAVSLSGATMQGSVSGGGVTPNGANFATDGQHGSYTISFTMNVTSDSSVTVSVNGIAGSVDPPGQGGPVGASISIPVYSTAQQQADAAAAEESRRQQEAINASIAASKAVEQSIAASKYAESSKAQQEIDDSIAAEQASIQESEAAIEESINASIAESASIEESIIQESLSIEESIEQSSLAVAESISESESEVERTKAVQIGSISYVPFKNGRNKFMFAAEDTELGVPEGFEKTDLMVNTQYVWAYRDADMEAHTYLVYGRFEKDDESQYYFYDETNGTFFQYGKLHAEEADLPILTTPVEAMQVEKKSGISGGILALLCAVSLLAGAGIAVLVMMYLKNRSLNSGMIAVAADDDEDFVQDEYSDEITESGEEYEFENKAVGLEADDVVINFETAQGEAVVTTVQEAERESEVMVEAGSAVEKESVKTVEAPEAAEVVEGFEEEELEVLEELTIDNK